MNPRSNMRKRVVPFLAALILLLPAAYAAIDRPRAPMPPKEITITLVGRAPDLGTEVVNFGLPLPPDFLSDAGLVRVSREHSAEVEAAYQAAHFVRTHTRREGPEAGAFMPKGSADLKYVYPRAQHIHYLLTGDERALEAGKIMAKLILAKWDPVYNVGFWTPRHEGYGLLGVLHGWELSGDPAYWKQALAYADALYQHQKQPPDGRPPDGSFRENWAQYDPSEAKFEGATSAWMMAILLDPMFYYWTLTGDRRIPEMVVKWCDFLDRQGLQPDGRSAYYVINCFAGEPGQPPSTVNGDMTRHDTEMSYEFAMGIFFSPDAARRAVYQKRFETLFATAQDKDFNQTARAFNWAFQASSQLVYFMQHPGGKP
jgi:hypothetical protein